MWYFFLSERINSYIQNGWNKLLLKALDGKIQEEKPKRRGATTRKITRGKSHSYGKGCAELKALVSY